MKLLRSAREFHELLVMLSRAPPPTLLTPYATSVTCGSILHGPCPGRTKALQAADRAMEAWYHSSIASMTPTGGSHGKLHRTTKILSHARRRGSGVAARGACAAADDTGGRVSPRLLH